MSKWQNIRLGDIADFSNGINFDKSSYGENGTYLIGVSDFGEELFPDYSTLRHIDSTIVRECNLLKDGDIVFVRSNGNKALVGRSMLIKNPPENTSFSGFCIRARIKDHESFDPLFFAYLFKSEFFRKAIAGCSIGANIQNLSQVKLASYMAYVPSIEIQRKIADVLSAYDGLIENNRKQIKLLEEAAQRLYKEWFIDLRFPGHETTPIIDGIPEGWEKKNLESIIGYEIGGGWGSDIPTNTEDQPGYVIRGTDINGITNGDILTVPFRYHAPNNLSSRILKHGDIIFEVSGGSRTEGVGKTLLITEQLLSRFNTSVICASFCKLIRADNSDLPYYLAAALKYWRSIGRIGEFEKKSASSIINYRWKDFLTQQKILLPSTNMMKKYNDIAGAIYNKIISLSLMIEKTKQTRDRLLPKLMTGELEGK